MKSNVRHASTFICLVVTLGILITTQANAGINCKPAPSGSVLFTMETLNEIGFISTATQQLEQIDTYPGNPDDLFKHPKRPVFFVRTNNDSAIEYFDMPCQDVLGSVSLPSGFGAIALNDEGSIMYVVDNTGMNINVIDVNRRFISQTYHLTSSVLSLAYSSSSHELFAAQPSINKIAAIDTRSGITQHPITPSGCHHPLHGCRPNELQAPANGQYLFATEETGGLAVFDANTHAELVNEDGGGNRGHIPTLSGFDAALNGVSVVNNYQRVASVAIFSIVPPFNEVFLWSISGPGRISVLSLVFDSAGIGYAADGHGLLFLNPDGTTKTLELNTLTRSTAYYP